MLAAALLSCDPGLQALFTPSHPALGRYAVCTTDRPIDHVVADPAPDRPHFGPAEMLEALDAFGGAGPYDRGALARLYGGKRVRVVRGWVERGDSFESVTLLSPYPDATLARLRPGTMVITWTLPRPYTTPRLPFDAHQ
ncbi:MAG: hypothetical protein ABUS56_03070 [Acidobacteriota bacterium]